jgi:hypothetical protein
MLARQNEKWAMSNEQWKIPKLWERSTFNQRINFQPRSAIGRLKPGPAATT